MLKNTIFVLIGVLIAYVLFLYLTYTDIEITVGEYDGYNVSMTKEEAYAVVISKNQTSDFYVMHPLNENGVGLLIKFDKNLMTYEYMNDLNIWSIYFDDNYHNVIKLSFKDNKLVKIYRHRKNFDLP